MSLPLPWHQEPGSCSSAQTPTSSSCPLYADCCPPNHQAPDGLVPEGDPAPSFGSVFLVHDASSKGSLSLTPRSAFEKFAAVQMIDVHIPTTDGRQLQLTRYTQPEPDLMLLINQLKLELPQQPPPTITAADVAAYTAL